MTVAEAQRYTDTLLVAHRLTRRDHPDVGPDARVEETAEVMLKVMGRDPVNLALVCAALCDRLTHLESNSK